MGSFFLITSILTFRVGIGVDRVSAQYIIEDEDTVYVDNDIKFFVEEQNDIFSSALSLSSLALSSYNTLKKKFGNFAFSGDLDLYRYHNVDTLHLNHICLDLNAEYDPGYLGCRVEGTIDHYLQSNRFFRNIRSVGGAVFWDNDQLDRRVGFEFDASATYVPDSSSMSNVRLGPEFDFYFDQLWMTSTSDLFIKRTIYKNPSDNRWEVDWGVCLTEYLAYWLGIYEEGEIAITFYDDDDEVSYDRQEFMIGAGPEVRFFNGGRLKAGPRICNEKNHPLGYYHDFIELSFVVSLELLFGGFNFFIENEFGRRSYDIELYVGNTNYTFDEVSLLGDISLGNNLDFQVYTSYGPEWHSLPQDNSTFFMVSSRLAYQF